MGTTKLFPLLLVATFHLSLVAAGNRLHTRGNGRGLGALVPCLRGSAGGVVDSGKLGSQASAKPAQRRGFFGEWDWGLSKGPGAVAKGCLYGTAEAGRLGNFAGVSCSGGKRFTEEEIASWPHIIFILGGPGSGKGTQCSKLCAEFKSAKHLSAGDLLRAERKKGTSQGEMIERYIKEGKIIPVEVTAKLLKDAIDKDKNRYDVFLIDGFPRDIKNHRGWEKMCGQGGYHVELMLMFECSEEIMTKRLLQRGKTSGRSDDNIASIRKRLRTYIKDTIPVVKSFEKQKKLVRIESNRPVNQVYAEVRRVFEPIMDRKLLGRRLFGGRLPSIRTLIKSSLTYNLVIRALSYLSGTTPETREGQR